MSGWWPTYTSVRGANAASSLAVYAHTEYTGVHNKSWHPFFYLSVRRANTANRLSGTTPAPPPMKGGRPGGLKQYDSYKQSARRVQGSTNSFTAGRLYFCGLWRILADCVPHITDMLVLSDTYYMIAVHATDHQALPLAVQVRALRACTCVPVCNCAACTYVRAGV